MQHRGTMHPSSGSPSPVVDGSMLLSFDRQIRSPLADARADAVHGHAVQFYESDSYLIESVADFVSAGLLARETVMVVARAERLERVTAALLTRGVDPADCEPGSLHTLDARTTLALFMDGAKPDPARFKATIGHLLVDTVHRAGDRRVRAYGEMVDVLWSDGNIAGAVALEELWNELAEHVDFSLLCAYDMRNFSDAAHTEDLRRICGVHKHVRPTERFTERDSNSRLIEIAVLQQRAQALETEIARRETIEAELRRVLDRLTDHEAELRDVLENAVEGIHCVTADGTIKWANSAELEMLGYTADEYIGHHIAEFHADEATINDMLCRLTSGDTLRNYRALLRCKDGSLRQVIVNSNALFRDGRLVHTRCFTRDITDVVSASEDRERLLQRERVARGQAERARISAEQANRAKSQFLAVMSHELRTPLNAIAGYAELLDLEIHGPLTSEQHDALDRIQRSQRHLLGLINEVLNYTRIEAGQLRYELADVSVLHVVQNVETLTLPQIEARGLRYQRIQFRPSVLVLADQEKVQQILLNLIGNATKFTDPGGRIILELDASDFAVFVRVRDTGIGIPPEKLNAIFDPFVQVDTNYTRTKDGIGLGLAISRDLARGMGGDLTVESVVGQGSTFTLALPRANA